MLWQGDAIPVDGYQNHGEVRQMRAAIPKSDFLDGGNAENIFTDLLDQEIGKVVSKRGIGIADMVYTQLQRD